MGVLNIIQIQHDIVAHFQPQVEFFNSCLAVALGAVAGSREATSCPRDGQLIFAKHQASRSAMYSIKVVSLQPGGEISNTCPLNRYACLPPLCPSA